MGATHCSLQVHVIFSTKDRLPTITDDLRDELHRFIGGTLSGLGASPLRVGGVADHVHLLFGYRATTNVADLVREVK